MDHRSVVVFWVMLMEKNGEFMVKKSHAAQGHMAEVNRSEL
jgi:hypothetical protein